MPGRTTQEAFENFIEPFKESVAVLDGVAKFVAPRKGGFQKGRTYAWTINGPAGMRLNGFGVFHAQMHFRLIDADPSKYEAPLRVTTEAYRYKLEIRGVDQWLIHWHPVGNSPMKEPHIHIPPAYEHLPTGRITFEKTIIWLIEQGAPLSIEKREALNRVAAAEAPHMLFRSWSDSPLPKKD